VAGAILAHEVTTGPGRVPVLAAGPWATGRPASLDPSYWSLTAMEGLAQLTGRAEWRSMAAGAVSLTRSLTRNGRLLPPDWAELTAAGGVRPEPAPNGSEPQAQYGLDAQRTVAGSRPPATRGPGRWPRAGGRCCASRTAQALALSPDGTILNPTPAALPLVAAAAAAQAAGDGPAVQRLLRQAEAQQHSHPTYYGSAWNALGAALLTTRSLSDC
jgi:hypothetical protein